MDLDQGKRVEKAIGYRGCNYLGRVLVTMRSASLRSTFLS
jgi:hypothetical protein